MERFEVSDALALESNFQLISQKCGHALLAYGLLQASAGRRKSGD